MYEAVLSGLAQVMHWSSLGFLFLGVVIGILVGLLPGLGGATAMVIMLPFVFSIDDPVAALALLLGMHSICNTAGDITSILFGVPGETTTAAMLLDGHPMAKNGEAGRALGASISSSLMGGFIGAVGVFLAVPILMPLVTLLGSPELFMLVVLGLTFIAALSSSSSLAKGFTMAGFGLLLGMVGMDPQLGIYRYTFDQLTLMDGIKIIPVTMGLFGIPEIIDLAVSGSSISRNTGDDNDVTNVWQGFKDTITHKWLILRCSLLGLVLSFVPGIGGSVSQWILYAHGVQTAKDKSKVGKGAIEGVLGPGAGTHAKECGALMPTLAFGVPGSVSMAILLSAFMILGLVPGPEMLTKHLDVTFSMVWVLVIANIISVVLIMLFIKQLAKVTMIRGAIIIPFLILLLFVGSFAETNRNENIVIMLVFGVLGWIMEKLNWPRPPVILGVVLGSLAERYLYISVGLSGYEWLARPGVIVIGIVIVCSLIYSVMSHLKHTEKSAAGGHSYSVWSFSFTAFLMIVFAYAVIQAAQWPFDTRLFPWLVGIPSLVLIAVLFIKEARKLLAAKKTAKAEELSMEKTSKELSEHRTESKRTIYIFIWMIAFLIIIYLIGFTLGLPIMIFIYIKFAGKERWLLAIILALAAFAVLFGIFRMGLHTPFTPGILPSLLGLRL